LLCAGEAALAADAPWTNLYPAGFAGRPVVQTQTADKKAGAKNGHDPFDVDSEHIFGITHGTDIGEKGEVEFEYEPIAAMGKRFGTYFGTAQAAFLKYTITDSFRIAPAVLFMTHDIRNVPGFVDHNQAEVGGALLELRYRIFDRETGPFGLTLSLEPGWTRVDGLGGDRVEQYGSEFAILIDKELVHDRLYGALNFSYDLSATRLHETGEWFHDSAVGIDLALSYQFLPGMLVGVEARYAQQYEGMGIDRLKGEALYVGPTFFARLGDRASLSGAWNIQVAGKAVDELGALDLVNFERHQVMLRLAILLNPKD
jgi:hypothetical protein